MRKLLTLIASAAMLTAPAMHADSLMTGQFTIQGTLIDSGTTLDFITASTGSGTQTGSFATLLSDNEAITGATTLTYSPTYTPDSEVLTIGSLTADLQTFAETSPGSGVFDGTALLSASGFLDTDANVSLTEEQDKGTVMFSAIVTAAPAPSVPEPSTFAPYGTGILGLAAVMRWKFFHA